VGKLPTLKPREVVALLAGLGFAEVRQRGSHKQSVMRTVVGLRFPSMQAATSRRLCCARSRRTSASRPSNFWGGATRLPNKELKLAKPSKLRSFAASAYPVDSTDPKG